MTADAAILAVLADGPLTAEQVARCTGLDLDAAGHRLRRMFGVRVTRADLVWRLLDTTAGSSLAALTTSGAAVSAGLRAQHGAGGAL
jgi:hypothetical protein